jgi:hypothetical protein
MSNERRAIVEKAIEKNDGILRLKPAWVARAFLSPGRRLGLPEDQYALGERGGVCERWLASTTKADNAVGPPDEGLSYLNIDAKDNITLREAIEFASQAIMGADYATTHKTLDRLAKIFDYSDRLPYHLHQMKHHAALVGRNPKEEAYYFPEGVDLGPHPETFFGVHPFIAELEKYDLLLPYLETWDSDLILRHARAYQQVAGEGFHIPAGVLHAPGSALTIELQEDSDVFAMLQARVGRFHISKELLFKDVRPEDRKKCGERLILDFIDWPTNGDPYFFEHRHTPPILISENRQPGGDEFWIFYNTQRFSGKKLVVKPGQKFVSQDRGVYNILVWRGKGNFGGHEIAGGNANLDELLIAHDRAVKPLEIQNTGKEDLIIIKFFGPDINADVPML